MIRFRGVIAVEGDVVAHQTKTKEAWCLATSLADKKATAVMEMPRLAACPAAP